MSGVKRVDILGCPFDAISFPETVQAIKDAALKGGRLHIVTGNIDFVMKARRDKNFADELKSADLVTADGVPIVWAASMLGRPLRGRVNGTDLVMSCSEISADTGCAVALIGGAGGVAQKAAARMQEKNPPARLFALPTPFPLTHQDSLSLAKKIKDIGAKIVLVALGAPRQERWIRSYLEKSGASVGIGIGSAFDIISGDKPRAPKILRDNGLEWFHRMLQEPGRLGKRYLVEDSPFVYYLFLEILFRRFRLKGRE